MCLTQFKMFKRFLVLLKSSETLNRIGIKLSENWKNKKLFNLNQVKLQKHKGRRIKI